MHKIFSIVDRISLIVNKYLMDIASIGLFFWSFVVTYYVIQRIFGSSWLFVEEFTEYFLVLFTYLTLGLTLREDGHIRIDTFTSRTSVKFQKSIDIVTNLLSLLVSIYLLNKSIIWLKDGYISKVASHYPSETILWPIYTIVSVGLFVFSLELAIKIYKLIYKQREILN